MKPSPLRIAGWGLGILTVFLLFLGPGLLAVPFTLGLGWWSSAARLLRAWHPGQSAVVLFALAVLLLLDGSHAFLRWLFRQVRLQKTGAAPARWPRKWTLCGFGILTCTLLAIGSLVLTIHQLYWMAKSSDPLFSDPIREKIGMLNTALALQHAVEAVQWDSVQTREAFWAKNHLAAGLPAVESIQPVWVEQDEQHLRAIVLVPRRPSHRAVARLAVLQPGFKLAWHKLEELPQVLAGLGVGDAEKAADTKPTLLP